MNATPIYERRFYGPSLVRVRGALCSDGRRRTAVVVGEPDTFFSQPAYVRVSGKTVAGFLTVDGEGEERDWEFRSYTYRRNGHLLP